MAILAYSPLNMIIRNACSDVHRSLFRGGGLSLGLHQAGWNCLGAMDAWKEAVETYRRNLRGHQAHAVDIHDVDAAWLSKNLADIPDWVVGGPPCQGWSTVGKRHRNDERNELFAEFMRIVRILRPANFLIENVLGLKDMGAAPDVKALFEGIGYRVSFHVVQAADYGVPQLRRRVIFVGNRHGRAIRSPPRCAGVLLRSGTRSVIYLRLGRARPRPTTRGARRPLTSENCGRAASSFRVIPSARIHLIS